MLVIINCVTFTWFSTVGSRGSASQPHTARNKCGHRTRLGMLVVVPQMFREQRYNIYRAITVHFQFQYYEKFTSSGTISTISDTRQFSLRGAKKGPSVQLTRTHSPCLLVGEQPVRFSDMPGSRPLRRAADIARRPTIWANRQQKTGPPSNSPISGRSATPLGQRNAFRLRWCTFCEECSDIEE